MPEADFEKFKNRARRSVAGSSLTVQLLLVVLAVLLAGPVADAWEQVQIDGRFIQQGGIFPGQMPGGSGEDSGTDIGFALPRIDQEMEDTLVDLRRYLENEAWDQALGQLQTLLDADPAQLVPVGNGMHSTMSDLVWRVSLNLPAQGQRGFRLFFEPQARRALEQARQKTDMAKRRTLIEQVHVAYFITDAGRDATSELAELAFMGGKFERAAELWMRLVVHHDADDRQTAQWLAQSAIALAMAGQRSAFDRVCDRLEVLGGSITLAGEPVDVSDLITSLRKQIDQQPTTALSITAAVTDDNANFVSEADLQAITGADQIHWRFEWVSQEQRDKIIQTIRNYWGYRYGTEESMPAWAVEEDRLFGQWLGVVFAIDLQTGKLLWTTDSFRYLVDNYRNIIRYPRNVKQYTVTAHDGQLLVTSVDPKKARSSSGKFTMTSLDPTNGKQLWSWDDDVDELKTHQPMSKPIPWGEQMLVTATSQIPTVELVCFDPKTGQANWTVELGEFDHPNDQRRSSYRSNPRLPFSTVKVRNGVAYVLTNNGALLAVDLQRQRINWAWRYDPPANTGQPINYSYNYRHMSISPVPGRMYFRGDQLIFKENDSRQVQAIDLVSRRPLWVRPIDREADLVGVDSQSAYLLDDHLMALDLQSRDLRWASRLPDTAATRQSVQNAKAIALLTSRGIATIDKTTGRQIGLDLPDDGRNESGDIIRTTLKDGRPISIWITDKTITAFTRKAESAARHD